MRKFAYILFLLIVFAFPISNSALGDKEIASASFTAAECISECDVVSDEDEGTQGEEISAEPGVLLYANDQNNEVGFVLNNVGDYESLEYRLKYDHYPGIIEMVQGQINNSSGNGTIIEEWIVLGFCSKGVCTYHQGVETVELEVDLIKDGSVEATIQDDINL